MLLAQVLHPGDLSRSENKEGYNKKENDTILQQMLKLMYLPF